MKEIITTITGWCDGDHDERTKSTVERTITFDFAPALEADLCDDCDKVIQAAESLMEMGREADLRARAKSNKTKPIAESHPCPICNRVSVSRNGLAAHLKKYHDLTFGQLNALSDEEIAGRQEFRLESQRSS